MKQAFSLFELILVLIIFGVILGVSVRPFENFYQNNLKNINQNTSLTQLNLALLQADKLFKNCINIQITNSGFSCFLIDSENILSLKKPDLSIRSSNLVLKKNDIFYSPSSNFTQILKNHQALFTNSLKELYFWQNGVLKSEQISSDEVVQNLDNSHFLLLLARLELRLVDKILSYELSPNFNNDTLKQSFILAQNISKLKLSLSDNLYTLELCNDNEICLKKTLIPDFKP